MDHKLAAFVAGLPKADLHLHLEGSLSPGRKRLLAARHKVDLPEWILGTFGPPEHEQPETVAETLARFLNLYYAGCGLLKTEQDFLDAAVDVLEACRQNSVRYLEMSFDGQAHTSRGVPLGAVIAGLAEARRIGTTRFGIECNLILCIDRERSVESAMALLDDAEPYQSEIIGIGLDSNEEGNPPIKFASAFARARSDGYRLTAHCFGEQKGSLACIWQCVDQLRLDRIDHGTDCIQDARLVDALREREICLTPCPTWRRGASGPRWISGIRAMYDSGLRIALGTDDPGLLESGMMNNMLLRTAAAADFDQHDLTKLMINAFEGAWIPAERKAAYVSQVNEYSVEQPSG